MRTRGSPGNEVGLVYIYIYIVIKHARKSLLFHGERTWSKTNDTDGALFDVAMGSYDGAEVCELVGLFILNTLASRFGNDMVGLYRDDGLMLVKGSKGRSADKARKELHRIFDQFGLKITADVCHQSVNFLDVTLNLKENNFTPYRKPNNDPIYIDSRSNHPPSIIRQLPKSINKRISSLSSDKPSFDSAVPLYEEALKQSNFNTNLRYDNETNSSKPKKRTRSRNIIWYNPPYSKNVKTKVAENFLRLIDKHFPKSSILHKIFNRNSVKVSYSCMSNIKVSISNHNRRVLKNQNPSQIPSKSCNCRIKSKCPLNGNCLVRSVVYKAQITSDNGKVVKNYIGMTAGPFKLRYSNHLKSLNNERYSTETELSKYAWGLKSQNKSFQIKWSVMKQVPAVCPGMKVCSLCTEEKRMIMLSDKNNTLNIRSELFSKCRHRNSYKASNFKRARASKHI